MKKYYLPIVNLILCFTIGCQSQSESSIFAQSGSSSIEPGSQEKSSRSSVIPDHLFRVSIDGYTGFIDRTGKLVIPPQFGPRTEGFSEGLCAVEVLPPGGLSEPELYYSSELTGKKFGYIDLTGKMVIPPQFDDAHPFSDGVAIVDNNSQTGWIDHQGNFVRPLTMLEDEQSTGFRQNRLWVLNSFLQTYFIDKTGKTVIKPIPDRLVGKFQDGFAQTRPNYFDPQRPPQFINLNGKVAFKNLKPFDCITDFSEGLAAVSPAGSKKFGYINTQGKYVIPPVFRVEVEHSRAISGPVIPSYSMFSDGMAVVPQGNKYLVFYQLRK
ncbi:MAG: WG repeat-containing protein [Acidobacteria bacterium]|nr:WG repeat-containing protein [Acidobacteriota bacterium]